MGRLFADGFDHYGSSEANMLDGPYADVGSCQLATTPTPSTGTHCLLVTGMNNPSNFDGLRKVLPSAQTKMGITLRLYVGSFGSDSRIIINFLSSSPNSSQISVVLDPNGRLLFYRGGTYTFSTHIYGTLLYTSDPLIVAGTWNHIEVQVNIDNTTGWFRCAVNGVHQIEQTELDTQHTTGGIVSMGHHNIYGAVSTTDFYLDDYILYDFTGTPAVDTDFCPTYDGAGVATGYIGELQVMWCYPDGNTAQDDWAKSTGSSAFALVDEVDPNDADYIYSTAVDDLVELAMLDLPPEITYIRGVDLWGRMSKADSGAAMVSFGMKSVAATEDAADRPVTTSPTYWYDQLNLDPNTAARWTRTGLNAAWMRLTRTV